MIGPPEDEAGFEVKIDNLYQATFPGTVPGTSTGFTVRIAEFYCE